MEGRFLMSTKELRRIAVVERVARGEITIKSAAEKIAVSPRQCRRLVRRYENLGGAGLAHKLCGRPSNRQADAGTRTAVIAAYKEFYPDFGPTLASEHMAVRQGLLVQPETLRLWLIDANLWQVRKQRRRHRKKRERKERFGEMIQFDGSHHLWFEDRGPKCCLMTMVDDATGKFHALFTSDEGTVAGYADGCGMDRAIRRPPLDLRRPPQGLRRRSPADRRGAAGRPGAPHPPGRACHRLGIRIIAAHSPQAKGRVENKHKLTKDRLMKEMRLAGISTIEAATSF